MALQKQRPSAVNYGSGIGIVCEYSGTCQLLANIFTNFNWIINFGINDALSKIIDWKQIFGYFSVEEVSGVQYGAETALH